MIFRTHALRRVAERGVTEEMVEEAWHNAVTQTTKGKRDDTRTFMGVTKSGLKLVLVVDHQNRTIIISVWIA